MRASERSCGMSRRGFLLGTAAGTMAGLAGGAAAWHGLQFHHAWLHHRARRGWFFKPLPHVRKEFTGRCVEVPKPAFPLPGRYPGKVVEIHDPRSVVRGEVRAEPVQHMIDRGMMELTGAPSPVEAWRSMFQKGDRVGIKVNPVGYARKATDVASVSNLAVIMAIIAGLKSAGLSLKDIVLYERYAVEFRAAGYEKFVSRELPGVGWYAASTAYTNLQTDLEGRDASDGHRPGPDPHVLGYDRDQFIRLGFTSTQHNDKDEASFQSHVSKFVTGDLVNKIITIPVLKDHRSGGVTLALKNISHGMANNVARTHALVSGNSHSKSSGDNHCGIFIPNVVALKPIRERNVLHIMDGLIGVYEGGPGSWNNSWVTWEYKSLFFATDPVALDHVGWDIIDAKRAQEGWLPVSLMGIQTSHQRSGSEQFERRQPEHVEIAGALGLGLFDPAKIEYRTLAFENNTYRQLPVSVYRQQGGGDGKS